MTETTTRPPCSTCGCDWSAEAFYAGCAECKACKRRRSRRNRVLAARKIALAERFVDALVALAQQGGRSVRIPVTVLDAMAEAAVETGAVVESVSASTGGSA